MEWIVRRLCSNGKLIGNQQLLLAGEVRGKISICEERDDVRRRVVRVARLAGPQVQPAVPPLFDVQILASVGGIWSLAGYERINIGPLQDDCTFGQSWWLTPAPDEDLIHAHQEVNRMVALLVENGIDSRAQPRGPKR